eukprot:COSAG06_NODE_1625_length_8891_cov_55.617379_4_plen_167_part_00
MQCQDRLRTGVRFAKTGSGQASDLPRQAQDRRQICQDRLGTGVRFVKTGSGQASDLPRQAQDRRQICQDRLRTGVRFAKTGSGQASDFAFQVCDVGRTVLLLGRERRVQHRCRERRTRDLQRQLSFVVLNEERYIYPYGIMHYIIRNVYIYTLHIQCIYNYGVYVL